MSSQVNIIPNTLYELFRSPPRTIHSCLRSLTPSDYSSKQLSLSPVSTPSKVITDSNYVGSLSELEGFHVLDIKTMCNENLDLKTYVKIYRVLCLNCIGNLLFIFMYIF